MMGGRHDAFMARYSAFSPYRLREREAGYPTPIGSDDAMAKSLYCGMKPIASWDSDREKCVPTGGVFNLEFSPEGYEKKQTNPQLNKHLKKSHSHISVYNESVVSVERLTKLYENYNMSYNVLNDSRQCSTKPKLADSLLARCALFITRTLLVAACEKKSIQIFDPLTHQKIHSVIGAHLDCVNCVKFLDGRMFATCSDDTTIALWDVRNLKKKIRSLLGHSKWVKNIEFSVKDKLLVTSGLDGSIYTWDINSYTEYNLVYQRVFHTSSLMRCRLSPDARQMVMCTTGGLLVIIHDLNLSTLALDLHGFKPNLYRLMQMSQQLIPIAALYDHLFDSNRKENRVEFISDFPEGNDAEVVSALQIHPQGWSALSRNISHGDRSEWTCIHDIQPNPDGPSNKSTRDSVFERSPLAPFVSSAPPVPPAPPGPPRSLPRRVVRRSRVRPYRAPRPASPLPPVNISSSESEVEREEVESEAGPSSAARTAASAPPVVPQNSRLGGGLPSIQNDVWEASITIKQNRMLQELYNRGQVRRNFNMQRITGINTGISPPNQLRAQRLIAGDGNSPSTSGIRTRDTAMAELAVEAITATRHYIRQNRDRLLYYTEETNEGKGFIKELCYSADGRLVCSPFGRGMRLLALNKDCSELSHCVKDLTAPTPMVDVGQSLGIHQDLVVSSRFSPRFHMLVTGCLEGKIVWYQPYSGEI